MERDVSGIFNAYSEDLSMTDSGGFVMDRRPSAGLGCQAVDQVGVETGPEAVVYVDDGDTVDRKSVV